MEGESEHGGINIEVWLNGMATNEIATTKTSADGSYRIDNIPALSGDDWYSIGAYIEGFSRDDIWLYETNSSLIDCEAMILHRQKWISFNWVYQPDGTTSLIDDGLPAGTATLYSGVSGNLGMCGFFFSTALINDPRSDIYFSDSRRKPYSFYANNGDGGIHDMGEVSLQGITEAPHMSEGVGFRKFYDNQDTTAIIGHTYCIVTQDGHHYAKIHVTDIGVGNAPVLPTFTPLITPPDVKTPTLEVPTPTTTHTPMPYNRIVAEVHSPVELRVYDSVGRVTGTINGEGQTWIPDSVLSGSMVIIYSPYDDYRYELVGTGEGFYLLIVTKVIDGETVIFSTENMNVSINELHEYTVDWDSIKRGDEGCTMLIDSDSDGTFDETLHLASSNRSGVPFWVWITTATIAILFVITISISWYYFYHRPKVKAVKVNTLRD